MIFSVYLLSNFEQIFNATGMTSSYIIDAQLIMQVKVWIKTVCFDEICSAPLFYSILNPRMIKLFTVTN